MTPPAGLVASRSTRPTTVFLGSGGWGTEVSYLDMGSVVSRPWTAYYACRLGGCTCMYFMGVRTAPVSDDGARAAGVGSPAPSESVEWSASAPNHPAASRSDRWQPTAWSGPWCLVGSRVLALSVYCACTTFVQGRRRGGRVISRTHGTGRTWQMPDTARFRPGSTPRVRASLRPRQATWRRRVRRVRRVCERG
jgi:hypothetical protein